MNKTRARWEAHGAAKSQRLIDAWLFGSSVSNRWMRKIPRDHRGNVAQPERGGFSLLELMIVLIIMGGVLAVVWPNLRKPLERSSVREAAKVVRDAIDSARYKAAMEGEVRFVQLRAGIDTLSTGSLASFLADSDLGLSSTLLSDSRQLDTRQPDTAPSGGEGEKTPAKPRIWQLPNDVVVLDVQWTSRPNMPLNEDTMASDRLAAGANDNAPDGPAGPSDSAANAKAVNGSSMSGLSGNAESKIWWLPFSSMGGGRDASIFLLDQRTLKMVSVRFESATGALEIVRE